MDKTKTASFGGDIVD